MKKITILVATCMFLAGWTVAGYCEDYGASDSETESSIEQSESQMGQGLDSEISGDRSEAEGEVSQVDQSMDVGGDGN